VKTARVFAAVAVTILALGLVTDTLLAQYYVPLRYDMRFTPNPGYIGPINSPPPAPATDPYSYGSLQYGNLMITGNVRGGRSFMGNTPYNQQGGQLSANVPSLALSNFKRDSVSIEDVTGPMNYGATTQPYFAGSASVTSLYTAQTRFATPLQGLRPAYVLPNLNSALPMVQPTVPPGTNYVPPVSPATATAIPQTAIDWIRALEAGQAAAASTAAATSSAGLRPGDVMKADPRIGKPYDLPPDPRLGLAGLRPTTSAATDTISAFTHYASTPGVTGTAYETPESAIFKAFRDAAMKERAAQAEAAVKAAVTASASPRTTPAFTQTSEEFPNGIPPTTERFTTPSTYAEYFDRATEAMKKADYARAEGLFAAAIVQDPKKSEAFFGRVYALLATRQFDLAYLLLDRDMRQHPDWIKQAPNIAKVIDKPGLLDRLTGELKDAVSRRPDNPNPLFTLGFIYYTAGDDSEALFYLRLLVKIRNQDAGPQKDIMTAIEARTKQPASMRNP
jgi:tetratricopeptide (TPR) repeat protein